jgi:hypothetical protein
MSRNPPQSFHETFMKTLGLRVYEYNPHNIGSPNAISSPMPINQNLVRQRNLIYPGYSSMENFTDYSTIQNTVIGLADEIYRFDDIDNGPSNTINNPVAPNNRPVQYLEM